MFPPENSPLSSERFIRKCYQTIKEQISSVLYKVFRKIEKQGNNPQLFYEDYKPDTKTRQGLKPVSPVLAGRFSTTVPPGKPL